MSHFPIFRTFLNCSRNSIIALPPAMRMEAAIKEVRILLVPKALKRAVFDFEIPEKLISVEMGERFLEISPPTISLIPDYQSIINEIEQSYVMGNDFSALSASCVVIERLLNQARIQLHKHHRIIKRLFNKGASNEWGPNIDALQGWGYLDKNFATELSDIYPTIRCKYLHSGPIECLRADALRAIKAAYRLMNIFIGFPEDLFTLTGRGLACKNDKDPRFLEFYKPYIPKE